MKSFKILFLATVLFNVFTLNAGGQVLPKNYESQWKKVEEFVKKGLPKSALTEVKKIYESAKKENQDAQVIKSLVYMTGLQQENREDNLIASIREIEKEIGSAKEPAGSILKSLAAELYWNYFQTNRWKFYDRTPTAGFQKEDIDTWTIDDFHKKISDLYLSSIEAEKLLQQARLEPFDAIIIKGNTRNLRPSLYDLLAHRALDYFKNDERDVTRPLYAFQINQVQAFAPAAEFVKQKFSTNDSASLHYKALLIFQDLINFHLRQKNTDALIDADIERLQFVKQYSVHPDKENLFFKAISRITSENPGLAAADQAWWLQAEHYEELAAGYSPLGDTTHRYDRKLAKEICEKIINKSSGDVNTEGKTNCYNLLQQIKRQELQFAVEKVNVPGQPFRSLVSYRNINRLYLRIIKVEEKLKPQLENQYDSKYWSSLFAAAPVKSWQQELPATNDFQLHKVEIKIDALSSGEYILAASAQKDADDKKGLSGARFFYVSNISYISAGNDFFVLNRDDGQPLENAAVQLWEQKYDSKSGKYIKEKTAAYKSDGHGYFNIKKAKTVNTNYLLDITYNNEKLFLNDLLYNYYFEQNEGDEKHEITNTWLFTDRGIYRPGQTVYFKGIVTGKNNPAEKSIVRANYKTKIYLRDANDEVKDSMKVKTNEFGSFSGTFQLPQGALNGGFSLTMENGTGSAGIQVEEYKRPAFYVDYEKIKGGYKVNDSIKLTGNAKAYAGNNIDNATVVYRVVRVPRFLYPWLFRKWWQPPSREMEIAHGELKTDKNGKFKIVFEAIPDLNIEKKFDPVFDYKVYADVTDINGETRSGETSVSVSYKSLLLEVNVPASSPVDNLQSVFIRTGNMSGAFEPAKVNVIISKLNEEKRLIRNRYWDRPDQFVMSREEYIRNFPHDEYAGENSYENWAKIKTVFERSDSVTVDGQWSLDSWKAKPGFYLMEVSTKDKEGHEIRDERFFELYSDKSSEPGRALYLWSGGSKPVEPGEKTTVKIGSSADNVFVIQQTGKNNDNEEVIPGFFQLNAEIKTFNISVTEADRGGYGVNYLFVKHNRFYQTNQQITVPWTNKDLIVEYASFRDKTIPGSEEKWKIKITGYKSEKVTAEMLASMYDASLDQFYPFAWNKPNIWPFYYNNIRWNGSQNFGQVQSNQNWVNEENAKFFKKEYDQLFSENYGGRAYAARDAIMKKESAANMMMNADMRSGNDSITAENLPVPPAPKQEPQKETNPVINNPLTQVRKNFNETAFFFPDLRTDNNGTIEFSFTMPEALTRWKFQALAHTKELALDLSSKDIVTQKPLMVQPNAPRFLREGDRMEFSAKIVNLSDKEIKGQAGLQLFDATTNQSVDGWFQNINPNQYFTVAAGQSESVLFPVQVPYQFNKALTWRIVARSASGGPDLKGESSDGEESSMPILTNRILVTESLPITMRGSGTKMYKFEKLLQSGESETLQSHSLTVEYTSNPAWYAIQALPYMMEYPYECSEQTWNRYYANSLAAMIVNSSPAIKRIFDQWKKMDTAALLSNLQKNQELKAVLLEETPWILQAKTEEQQKKNIALLFDLARMGRELNNTIEKLKQMQIGNGGFVWFKGGPDDRYITQYIVTGIGHLKKLNGLAKGQDIRLKQILATAIPYLDKKIKTDYDDLVKNKTDLSKYVPGFTEIQYLYMRGFFPEFKLALASQKAYLYYANRIQKTWTRQNRFMQGMVALVLFRAGDTKTSGAILNSLRETAILSEETGMYWKNQGNGWFWYQAPVETQALLIEAFIEAGKDPKTADDLKSWLLKNKQTNNWRTTKATAEACYALLLKGTNPLTIGVTVDKPEVVISLGSTQVKATNENQEAGTGYFKKAIQGDKVNPGMGNISVRTVFPKTSSAKEATQAISWGAVYWQYFENTDKVSSSSTPLKLVKKLFIEKNSDRGPVLIPVNDGDAIKLGNKIRVRIELRADRDMEYVHMKDMRAAGLEPINVLSKYKWQDGLGYYETTKDAGTNFFFSNLERGTYVFEYSLFATNKGNFSNGITSIQCMYAPEFNSHSEGIRINVE